MFFVRSAKWLRFVSWLLATFFRRPSHYNNNYKALVCRNDVFARVDGFSNDYWGWGKEDLDFYLRMERCKFPFGRNLGTFRFLMDGKRATEVDHDIDDRDMSRLKLNEELFRQAMEKQSQITSGLRSLRYRILGRRQIRGVPVFTVEI